MHQPISKTRDNSTTFISKEMTFAFFSLPVSTLPSQCMNLLIFATIKNMKEKSFEELNRFFSVNFRQFTYTESRQWG